MKFLVLLYYFTEIASICCCFSKLNQVLWNRLFYLLTLVLCFYIMEIVNMLKY